MAKITKDKLEHLTNEEIKGFYTSENTLQYHVSPIKEFLEEGRDSYELGMRVNRVEKILNLIIVERFINGLLK